MIVDCGGGTTDITVHQIDSGVVSKEYANIKVFI